VPIIVPEVDKVPILTVRPVLPYENELDRLREVRRWDALIEYEDEGLLAYLDIERSAQTAGRFTTSDQTQEERRAWFSASCDAPRYKLSNGLKCASTSYYPYQVAAKELYAEDNPRSLYDAEQHLKRVLHYYFPGDEPDLAIEFVEVRGRARKVESSRDSRLGGTVDSYPMGTYFMGVRQCLQGIPILTDMGARLDLQRFDGEIWGKFWPIWGIKNGCFEFMRESSFELSVCWFSEEEKMVEDVPLASIRDVVAAIESEIVQGRIRKVYSLSLGYACFLNANSPETYTLYPVWTCDCDYVELPEEEISKNIWDDDYRHGFSFTQVILEAQTGKMQPVWLSEKEQFDCPKIITWEEAQ